MALWIRHRPEEVCDLEELKVADALSVLSDDWVIRWGFFYRDNQGVNREGDFLVLGPHGGLMVIEVKSGTLDPYWGSGKWATATGDHPLIQLDAEWNFVVNEVRDHRGDLPSLFVVKALALPGSVIASEWKDFHDIPREFILDKRELSDFPRAWDARFSKPNIFVDGRARQIFFDTFGKESTPKAIRHFVSETDRALMRHTECSFELLDQLSANRQFLAQGGVGSGKTWMAFELARRWAEEGEGKRVLFLTYNLALTDLVKELVGQARKRKRPSQGEIVVMSWEELAQSLFQASELPYEPPSEKKDLLEFYEQTVPELMAEVVHRGGLVPSYDALIVDEGQDHDTQLSQTPDGFEGPGWWGIYWKLLKDGNQSPMAVFCDPAQRPEYRVGSRFDLEVLRAQLGTDPVLLTLTRTVRYSAPIYRYLKSLDTDAVSPLSSNLNVRDPLPEGPEVERVFADRASTPEVVEQIIGRWISTGLCRAEQILLISKHGSRDKSSLAEVNSIQGLEIVDYLQRKPGCISMTSAQKSKGLDALAVVLIDFPPFEEIEEPGFQTSFFIGASRARQLLAVVSLTSKTQTSDD